MPGIVGVDRVNATGCLGNRLEREQAIARGQVAAEAGFLCNYRAPGCQVAHASITEPAAPGLYVATLGNSKLAFGLLDEFAIFGWRVNHLAGIDQAPAVLG